MAGTADTRTMAMPPGFGVDADSTSAFFARKATVPGLAFALAMTGAANLFLTLGCLRDWDAYVPVGTSFAKPLFELTGRTVVRARAPIPAATRINDLLRYLGLTKTQLKDICGVSRQTLYDWLAGKFEPEGSNAARLAAIHDLALQVPLRARTPIRAALLSQPLFGTDTFLDVLKAPRLDQARLEAGLSALLEQTSARDSRSARSTLERLGFAPPSDVTKESILAENMEDADSA
jgi:transcriptional regulator with XRE-family HTH domain